MFRKTTNPTDDIDRNREYTSLADFFGNEDVTAHAAEVTALDERVAQMESRVSSQFTSLATYSQIAQEQIELVRSEARHENRLTEERLMSLIERERSDRESQPDGHTTTARLAALENRIDELNSLMRSCLATQDSLLTTVATLVAQSPSMAPPDPATRLSIA